MQRFGCSQRNALRVVKMSISTYLYRSVARDTTALRLRIQEITQTRVHYGYRRVHVMLQREGHKDNIKRVYRLYREEGLSLRLKRPRRNRAAKLRQPKQLAFAMNEVWSMDFVADALFDGRKLRMLTVVDCYTRECLAIDVGQSLKGEDVANSLNRICAQRGLPKTIKTDNGSVHLQGHGQVGLRACRRARLQPPGQADRQRARRELQRPAAPGVPELQLVPVARGRQGQDRRLADVLQRESTTLRARLGHAYRVRPSMRPAGRIDDPQKAGSSYF